METSFASAISNGTVLYSTRGFCLLRCPLFTNVFIRRSGGRRTFQPDLRSHESAEPNAPGWWDYTTLDSAVLQDSAD